MELLQYKYHNAYVIQASSTDIGMSWRKFNAKFLHDYLLALRKNNCYPVALAIRPNLQFAV